MSMEIRLLDCTLRDGGYINDWEFGHNNIINVFERVAESRVDIIEIGFIDDRRPYDYNRSIFPDTTSIRRIYGMAKHSTPVVVGMIDYGTCDINNIEPCHKSLLDGIRVIFKKHRMHEAMEYCRQLKKMGYKVFSQLVSITSYSDEELIELTKLVNDVQPYAVSMVDTYGLLYPSDLLHYYDILEKNVDASVSIGFHAHNNLQLAYANSITFIEQARQYNTRDVVVDGTLYGMGKSAGNAPIELIAPYLNQLYGDRYDVNHMLESIEESIKDIYASSPWGYKTIFYLASENKCHPNYVSFFESKGNLSKSSLNELLSLIEPEEKKLLYDRELAESLYNKYVDSKIDDTESAKKLSEIIDGRVCLLIGPGKNINLQKDKVNRYISDKKPVVISINYIPKDIAVDYVFVTKVSRYGKMSERLHVDNQIGIISTSNVEVMDGADVIKFNREPLLEKKEDVVDNSLLMLLKVIAMANVKKLALAGFDGYSEKEDNYFEPSMEYGFVKSIARNLNRRIREELEDKYSDIDIEFVTYSHYMHGEDIDSATF